MGKEDISISVQAKFTFEQAKEILVRLWGHCGAAPHLRRQKIFHRLEKIFGKGQKDT